MYVYEYQWYVKVVCKIPCKSLKSAPPRSHGSWPQAAAALWMGQGHQQSQSVEDLVVGPQDSKKQWDEMAMVGGTSLQFQVMLQINLTMICLAVAPKWLGTRPGHKKHPRGPTCWP